MFSAKGNGIELVFTGKPGLGKTRSFIGSLGEQGKDGAGYSSVVVKGERVFTMGAVGSKAFVYAVSRKTGKKLWEAPANTGVIAAPVTYSVDGEQYVTFMAGWGGAFALGGIALGLAAIRWGLR